MYVIFIITNILEKFIVGNTSEFWGNIIICKYKVKPPTLYNVIYTQRYGNLKKYTLLFTVNT